MYSNLSVSMDMTIDSPRALPFNLRHSNVPSITFPKINRTLKKPTQHFLQALALFNFANVSQMKNSLLPMRLGTGRGGRKRNRIFQVEKRIKVSNKCG